MEEKEQSTTPAPPASIPTPMSESPAVPSPVTSRKKFPVLIVGIILLLLGVLAYFFFVSTQATQVPNQTALNTLPTYFSYTNEELQSLKNLKKPEHVTTIDDLYQWEEEAYDVVAANKTVAPEKFYSYLLAARRDALLLTRSMHKEFRGDTSVISKKILCEFYPNNCAEIQATTNDAFSEQLATLILQKVKQRIADDAVTTKEYPLKDDPKYWYAAPQIGRDAGSYKTWLIDRSDQFRVPENPQFAVQNFQSQLAQVKTALAKITSEQRKAVVFWAGGPGTKTPPGIWLDIAGEYMIAQKASVEKYLETQTLLSLAMTDSLISCFDSKYTYQVKRPYMVDPTIKTVMPTPNHPSYPAGHSCVSNTAATILAAQLSENTTEWQRLAEEASSSRIWGGIHYPVDDEQGSLLGKQVGEFALTRFKK